MKEKKAGSARGEYVEVDVNELREVLDVIGELAGMLSQALDRPAGEKSGRVTLMLSRPPAESEEDDGYQPGRCDGGGRICAKLWKLMLRLRCPQTSGLGG